MPTHTLEEKAKNRGVTVERGKNGKDRVKSKQINLTGQAGKTQRLIKNRSNRIDQILKEAGA